MSLNEFEAKRNELKGLMQSIKNKELLKYFFRADTSLDTQYDLVKQIIGIENDLSFIKNKNIEGEITKDLQVYQKNLGNFEKKVKEVKDTYVLFESYKNNIAKGKIFLEKIKNNEFVSFENINEIQNIILNTDVGMSQELGFDIFDFKKQVISYFSDSYKDTLELKSELELKDKILQEEVKNNLDLLKNDYFTLRETVQQKINIYNSAEVKDEILKNEINKLKQDLIEKGNTFTQKRDEIKKEIGMVQEKKLEYATNFKQLDEILQVVEKTKNIDIPVSKIQIEPSIKSELLKDFSQSESEIRDEYDKISLKIKENIFRNTDEAVSKVKKEMEDKVQEINEKSDSIKLDINKTIEDLENTKKEINNEILENTKKEIEQDIENKKKDIIASFQEKIKTEKEKKSNSDELKTLLNSLGNLGTEEEILKFAQTFNSEVEAGKYLGFEAGTLSDFSKIISPTVIAFDSVGNSGDLLLKSKQSLLDGITTLAKGSDKLSAIALSETEGKGIGSEDRKLAIQKKAIDYNIALAISNISKKISDEKKAYEEYLKSGEYNDSVANNMAFKIKSYEDLKQTLSSNETSITEKTGLVSLMGKGQWLKDYVNHRKENYKYDSKEIERQLKTLMANDYDNVKEGSYYNLYKKGVDEKKFSLIEEFATLKSSIPEFYNINLDTDLHTEALKHGINDDETLEKIDRMNSIKQNLNSLDFSQYNDTFLKIVDKERLKIENKLQSIEDFKNLEYSKIDTLDITPEQKDVQKLQLLDQYEKQKEKILKSKNSIDDEYNQIEKFIQEGISFSREEKKNISENMNLFSIVGNTDKYDSILTGITEDIVSGNTDFITFENYKNLKTDIYTSNVLSDIINTQESLLISSIDNLGDDLDMKVHKKKLIENRIKFTTLKQKLEKGNLLDSDVLNLLSKESLYQNKLMKRNEEIIGLLQKGDLPYDEINSLKNELTNNFNLIDKIEKGDGKTLEELNEDINENAKSVGIDFEQIQDELNDGFDNFYTTKTDMFSRYGGNTKEKIANAKRIIGDIQMKEIGSKVKIASKVIFGEKSYEEETEQERLERHRAADKYISTAFTVGASFFIVLFFGFFKKITDGISYIPEYVDTLKNIIEKNKSRIFIGTMGLIFLLVLFSDKVDYTFVSLNTNLYSVGNYQLSDGNLSFSNILDGKISIFYYKLNVFLFFMFLIVFYQIIVEFISKYIYILKNPTIGVDMFLGTFGKFLLFFLFMALTFKVNVIL